MISRLIFPVDREIFEGYLAASTALFGRKVFRHLDGIADVPQFDGHDHILEAARLGAKGVLGERPYDLESYGCTCGLVDNTSTALPPSKT